MFRAQLSPPDFKELTQAEAIKVMGPPKEVILPLLQHTGAPAEPTVAQGNKLKVGGLIAAAKGYVSAPIHSSVCGEVRAIEARPHPTLGRYPAIVIESDGEDNLDAAIRERQNVVSLCADEIRKIIRDCGVVGLGGAAFPTHVKLTPPKEKPIDTFIVNGAECEPYLTADERLMLEEPKQIILGMRLAMKVLGAQSGIVAIEENKPEAIKLFQELLADEKFLKVAILKSFYPQGGEKQLIKTLLRREVPSKGLPFDVGVVVNNVATCLAIYEAVYKAKPLYERVITVTGKIIPHPANLKVRLGTKIKEVLDFCGGLSAAPAKVIVGGPMMGLTQYTLDVPVIKSTSAILVMNKEEAKISQEGLCIRCGCCVRACPVGLLPCLINLASQKEMWPQAQDLRVEDCIECGLCSYVCPAENRLTQYIKRAKLALQ